MSRPLLQVRGMAITFEARRGGTRRLLQAVRGVDLDIDERETVGLVGESGSGKSTIARGILGLQALSAGSVVFDGRERVQDGRVRNERGAVQAVFQHPYAALDPSMTVGESIAEPLHALHSPDADRGEARVRELLEMVNLPGRLASSYPRDLSGGQRQRVNIARAIATHPKLVVLDEPLSALDISTQSQVFNLLESLRRELGMSYLFIAHDLAMVHHASARIAVVYLGRIVEYGDADSIYLDPRHPYTQALVASSPIADPAKQRERRQERRRLVRGELPSPFAPPAGCAFHPRCPGALDRCKVEPPALAALPDGRLAACHLVGAAGPGNSTQG